MLKNLPLLAYAFCIIVGGLMITNLGVFCIACGGAVNIIASVILIAVGIIGVYGHFQTPAART